MEEAQAALARKHLAQQEYVDRADRAEAALAKAEDDLDAARDEISKMKQKLNVEIEKREEVSTMTINIFS